MLSPQPNHEFPSPLYGFYTISKFSYFTKDRGLEANRSIKFEPRLFNLLSTLCESHHRGFPVPPNWGELSITQQSETIDSETVDADIKIWIRSLPTEAAISLLELFQQYSGDPIVGKLWTNYYMSMCHIVALKIWKSIPTQIRTHDKLDSILAESYALFSRDSSNTRYAWSGFPNHMLYGFNLEDSPNLGRLGAWSYRTIRQALRPILDGTQHSGEVPFSNRSVLSIAKNTSNARIRKALMSIDILSTVRDVLNKKYPSREQEQLKGDLIQEINNHLGNSIVEEQYNRCRLLTRTFNAYDVPTNDLVESNFVEIGNFCQQRLITFYRRKLRTLHPRSSVPEIEMLLQQQVPTQMSPEAIEILLKSIGTMVRQDAIRFLDPTPTDAIVSSDIDGDLTYGQILTNLESPPPMEIVYSESLSEKFQELYQEIENFCQLPPARINRPSHQQIFWLYYGLDINQINISSFLNIHFNLSHPNPGGVSAKLNQARISLVLSIREKMDIADRLDEDAIESVSRLASQLASEVVEKYFSAVRRRLLRTVASQLGIDPSADLTAQERNEFINLFTTEIEQMSRLNHRDGVSQAAIETIVNNFTSLYRNVEEFFQLQPAGNDRLSHQQVLWLNFGLGFSPTEVDIFSQNIFQPTNDILSISLDQSLAALASHIYNVTATGQIDEDAIKLDEDAIKLAIEVLETYFPAVYHRLLRTVASQMGIDLAVGLTEGERTELINFFTAEIERMSRLIHRNNISQAAIEKIVEKLLIADT
jgi:hypothetical protein